jgi:hypothetical protein
MRKNYEENLKKLGKSYSFLSSYNSLPIKLFPLSKDKYWVFYPEQKAFRPKTWIIYKDWLIEQLIIDDALDFAWLKAELDEWEDNEIAFVLYNELDKMLTEQNYSPDIEERLALYEKLSHRSERSFLLWGRYYFEKGDIIKAAEFVKAGLRKRKLNFELNVLAGDIEFERGNYIAAVKHYLLMSHAGRARTPTNLRPRLRECTENALIKGEAYMAEFKAACELSLAKPNLYPFVPKVIFDKAYNIRWGGFQIYDKPLEYGNGKIFFFNLYNEKYAFNMFDVNRTVMEQYISDSQDSVNSFHIYTYHLLNGRMIKEYSTYKEELVAIVGIRRNQPIEFISGGSTDTAELARQEVNYFRLHENTTVRSDSEFVIGERMNKGHSPKRKKLVLNILVDALSFAHIKERDYKNIPHIMKFFSKGVIFANNYTPAEWTYPSFAAIQTGMRIDQTQIFSAEGIAKLDKRYKTLAEYLDEQGYLCLNTMDGADCVLNESCRGFTDSYYGYINRAHDSVERTIQYIETFGESDLYVNLHFDDVHKTYGNNYQMGIKNQTELYPEEYCESNNEKSVRAKATRANILHYENGLKDVDRILGNLFQYIEENYAEDEYVVMLYSDHGVSMFADTEYMLSQSMANSAMMFCGGGYHQGIVSDEVTSTLDILAIMAKLLNFEYDDTFTDTVLPKALGGRGREYAISQCLYAGQPYCMAINTVTYEFAIKSMERVTSDGRVCGNKLIYNFYNKDKEHTVCTDRELLNKFLRIYKENVRAVNDADFEKIYGNG